MASLFLSLIVFLFSVFALDFLSTILIEDAKKVASIFRIPEFLIGVSLVAMGTSIPELATALYATLVNHSELAIADAVGSSIGNVLLSLGIISIMAGKIVVEYPLIHVDLPYMVAAAFFSFLAFNDGVLSKSEAVLMLIIYFSYFFYLLESSGKKKEGGKIERASVFLPVRLVIEGILIWISARFAIESLLAISKSLGLSAEALAAVLIAISTGLPELIVSFKGVRKGLPSLAVGNLLGSNIFNIFGILGLSGLVGRVVSGALTPLLLEFFAITSLLFFFISQENEITKWEGALLLAFYALYIVTVF